MKIDHSIITFSVFEDATEYLGIADASMPDVSFLTQSVSGAGIGGNIDSVLVGMTDAMSMTLNFRNLTVDAAKLTEPRRHNLTLRAAMQTDDTVAGQIGAESIKHVIVATPKSLKGGTLKPASQTGSSAEYAVSYWAAYQGNKKILEIDPLNFICNINGTDYLATVRKALGK